MSARTPNNIPANGFSLAFAILAIHPDGRSSPPDESFTVALLGHDEKPKVRTGLDMEAIGRLAGTHASGILLAAYGPEDHLTERLWRIAAGIDAVVLDVCLLARILLPGLRDYERATVERCVEPEPAESADGVGEKSAEAGAVEGDPEPAENGADDALKTALLCRALLDLLASQDPETTETLILLAEGTGSGLERLLARMAARTAGHGVMPASHADPFGLVQRKDRRSPIPRSVRPRSATARVTRPKPTTISISWTRRSWPACSRPVDCSKAAWTVTSNGRSRYPWSAASPARSTKARCCWWKRVRARGSRSPT